jgi:hypothetical protein
MNNLFSPPDNSVLESIEMLKESIRKDADYNSRKIGDVHRVYILRKDTGEMWGHITQFQDGNTLPAIYMFTNEDDANWKKVEDKLSDEWKVTEYLLVKEEK